MKQRDISGNLSNWDYISSYSDWMYRSYGKWVGKRVFDVGAGMGRMIRYYVEQCENVIATDIFSEQVDYMNQMYAQYPQFHAEKLDILTDDLERFQGQFDTVLCINVLEHLADDEMAVSKMKSLLTPSGHCIIFVPAMSRLYCALDRNVSHYRRYDKGMVRKLAERNAMKVVHDSYFNFCGIVPYWLKGKRLKNTEKSFSSDFNEKNTKIYNWAAKILEPIERAIPPMAGLSEIVILQKTEN